MERDIIRREKRWREIQQGEKINRWNRAGREQRWNG